MVKKLCNGVSTGKDKWERVNENDIYAEYGQGTFCFGQTRHNLDMLYLRLWRYECILLITLTFNCRNHTK